MVKQLELVRRSFNGWRIASYQLDFLKKAPPLHQDMEPSYASNLFNTSRIWVKDIRLYSTMLWPRSITPYINPAVLLFCEDCEGECLHHVCASSAMTTGAYWSNCPDLYRFSSSGNNTSTCFVHKRRLLMHVRHGFCHRTFSEPFAEQHGNWNLRAAQHGTWGLLSAIVVQSNTPPDAQTWRRWRRWRSRCSEHGRIEVHPLQKVPNLVVQ